MKAAFSALRRDFANALRAVPGAWRSLRWVLLATVPIGVIGAVGVAWIGDEAWAAAGSHPFGEEALAPGRWFSRYGELQWAPLFAGLLLWYAGYRWGRVRWREAAVAALLAAIMAGAAAALAKGALGRARPELNQPWEFVGPSLHSDTQAFPSGHTTHCVAFAGALVLLAPEVGVPALVIPALAAWGRLALHKHYPSDIAGGIYLGAVGSVIATMATLRNRKRVKPRYAAPDV